MPELTELLDATLRETVSMRDYTDRSPLSRCSVRHDEAEPRAGS